MGKDGKDDKDAKEGKDSNEDKRKQICKSIMSLAIIKFIIRNVNPDEPEIKLIFVGQCSASIKNILTKLEKQLKLNQTEHRDLEVAIPFYTTKFGSLENYNVFFIYKYMEENISIYHTRIILYETIKERLGSKLDDIHEYVPEQLLIYKYSRNMDYQHYITNYLLIIFIIILTIRNYLILLKMITKPKSY